MNHFLVQVHSETKPHVKKTQSQPPINSTREEQAWGQEGGAAGGYGAGPGYGYGGGAAGGYGGGGAGGYGGGYGY